MSVAWIAYVSIPVVTLVVSVLLAYWIYAEQVEVPGSRWFVATLAGTSVWMALHVAMLVASDPGMQLLAHELETKAATASFLAFAVFASRYSRTNFHRHVLGKLAIGLTGAVLVLPTFLTPLAEVLYRSRTVVTHPFSYVVTEPGLVYVALLSVSLGLTAAGLFSLLRYLLSTPRNSGAQLVLLILGSLSIPLVTVLGFTGVFPATELNHATYGAPGFVVLVSLALFWFQLFELQPVARNAIVEELTDPVFVLDRDRNLTDFNRAATRVVPGIEGLVGEPLSEVYPALDQALAEPGDDGAATSVTLSVQGHERHYSVNVSHIGNGDGRAVWYSVVLRDVTDIERSRWQLQKQNERLDQVAGTISHDLRNPINVAHGFTEVLEDHIAAGDLSDDEREVREYVEKIQTSHDRMLDIIDDILTIAREGKTVDETERVGLGDVARDAWENVETREATLAVTEETSFPADRSKLLTVFENLFRNAIEHGGDDVGVEVGATGSGFFVQDDGPGVDTEHRDNVFEYGYSTGRNNTGLGLSIVRTMAESHGWTVDLDDDYEEGARFVFGFEHGSQTGGG